MKTTKYSPIRFLPLLCLLFGLLTFNACEKAVSLVDTPQLSTVSSPAIDSGSSVYGGLATYFNGQIPNVFVKTLIYMGEELSYTIQELQDIGAVIIACQSNPVCLRNNLSVDVFDDLEFALRIVSLPAYHLDLADNSVWQSNYDEAAASLQLTHQTRPVVIDFDLDGGLDDGKAIGIIATIDGKRYSPEDGSTFNNLFHPTEDGGRVDSISILIDGDNISFYSEGGTYDALGGGTGDFDPVFMQSDIHIENDFLEFDLAGIYYIYFPKDTVSVIYQGGGLIDTFVVEPLDIFLVYRPFVEELFLPDAYAAPVRVFTDVERIQFDARPDRYYFEFDFDHSYKDRGQKSILSTVVIEEVIP